MQAWRLGSYELLRRLGEGGMAQVYLARDIRLGREVAVKVLDQRLAERPGFRERFEREARVAASLDHPNIVQLYDFGDSERQLYLVMPYVSGGSLQDMLRRAPFAGGEVATFGSQMADALDYAHQRGVIHRDVKPANMLVHADGRLLLSDFGLAKILSSAQPQAAPRRHPDAGTPEYMAPEQIEGRSDERTDIYALGVVLYLLLTSHLPFTGGTSAAVMEGHLYQLPEEPRRFNRAISPAMQAVVLRALAKHPDDRFQRAGDLGAALLGALVAGDAAPLSFAFGGSQPSQSLPPIGVSGAHSLPPIGRSGAHASFGSGVLGLEPAQAAPAWEPPQVAPAWEAPQVAPVWQAPQVTPAWEPPQLAPGGFATGTRANVLPRLQSRASGGPAFSRPQPENAYSPAAPASPIGRSFSAPNGQMGQRLTSAPVSGVPYHAAMRASLPPIAAPRTPFPSALPLPNALPSRQAPGVQRELGQRLWLVIVIALLVALLASGVLLRWLQDQSTRSLPHTLHAAQVSVMVSGSAPWHGPLAPLSAPE